jgi:hypothetical protein
MKLLKEIFNCTEYKASRSHFEMKYKHGKTQPCFVLMDECAFEKWFKSHDNYSNAKLAFEGQGIVLEQKQKHPKLRWKGVPIIITSNVLPSVVHETVKKDTEEMW